MKSRQDILLWLNQKLKELGRPENSVTLLAVSKLQPVEKIIKIHNEGQIDFGENYIQEALMKMEELEAYPLRWHLIGHLQKNKIKQAVGVFEMIHSGDSLELIEKINARAAELNMRQKILIQINQAEETSKTGFQQESFLKDWLQLKLFNNIKICGLMCLPPLFEDPEQTRPFFRSLKNLLDDLKKNNDNDMHPLDQLSMGTSHDFQVAVEEGSTILRIGTSLFGERIVSTKGIL